MASTERSTKQVVEDTRTHLTELVQAHIDLAKAEVNESIQDLVRVIAPLAIAGVIGLYLLGFVGVTAAKVLELWLVEWAAWLIVTGVMILVVGALGLVGRSKAKSLQLGPVQTRETVKDTVSWAKTQTKKVR